LHFPQELDRDEFHEFVSGIAPTLGMTVSDFCESLIVDIISTGKDKDSKTEQEDHKLNKEKLKQKVKKRGEILSFLDDKGMSHSFVLHDL
jgi:hypothetical protein